MKQKQKKQTCPPPLPPVVPEPNPISESSGRRGGKRQTSTEFLDDAPERRVVQRRLGQYPTTAADVVEHQARAKNYAITNAQAEVKAIMQASLDREDVQAPSTKKHYTRFQAHWMDWCRCKRYDDGDRVNYKKFVTYLQELLAEETIIDPEDDYYSILPLRIF
ncbi:hypothetical protein BGZ58_005852, partial [Dissophora ornata]